MKIYYWTPYMGNVGTIKATINSAIAMKERGHEVKLYKPYREWEGYEDVICEHGIDIIDFGLDKKFSKLPVGKVGFRISMVIVSMSSWRKLKKNWEEDKPDVVLAYLLGYFPLFVRKHAKYKPKIVNSIQGKPKFNRFRRWLWKKLYMKSDWLITLSEKTRKDIIKYIEYPEERITIVTNPIIDANLSNLSNEALDPVHANIRKPIILGVGRLTRQKDFATLINAFYIVNQQCPCHLWILGEGEQQEELQSLIDRLNLKRQAELLGFVKNPYKYMKKADVFVLSSLWEDAGHVLVEAAYLKLKLVSTRCPYGQEEFLDYGKRGELCEVQNPIKMADAILNALNNNNLIAQQAKIERAYNASLDYEIERHGTNLEQLIKTIC